MFEIDSRTVLINDGHRNSIHDPWSVTIIGRFDVFSGIFLH